MIDAWIATIARPDFADWVTVAAYLIAAMLAARAARHAALRPNTHERLFWRIASFGLVILGINELLDLQTLLTVIARAHAKSYGWYDGRLIVQEEFVIGLIAATLVGGIALFALTRRMHGAVRIALAGFAFIGVFVLFRAASIHHLDRLFGLGPAFFNVGSMQEMAGILVVMAAAWFYMRSPGNARQAK